MPPPLQDPVAIVQNPAFGAALLWRFGLGFQEEKGDDLASMLLFFTVLPLVLHTPTLEIVTQTRVGSGLSAVASKLATRREDLIAVHERCLKLRALTLEALATGVTTRLLSIDYEHGQVRANEATSPQPPERLKRHLAAAEKIGRWLGKTPAHQAFTLLQVQV